MSGWNPIFAELCSSSRNWAVCIVRICTGVYFLDCLNALRGLLLLWEVRSDPDIVEEIADSDGTG